MPRKLNESEAFVHWVCQKSFLSLWCYASPRGKKGKELCDILVVCNPDIVVISVKDIAFNESVEDGADCARWRKRAVDGSVKQIYGAERWLATASHVIRTDGSVGLPLPSAACRRVHRVAIAFGAAGKVTFNVGDFGKGYVHVLDEQSFRVLLSELDTITDFVEYLREKERLTSQACVMFEGEENLLALYLHGGRQFPDGPDFIVVEADLWQTLREQSEFKRREIANRQSYAWDRVIESLAKDIQNGNLECGPELAESELAIRAMAKEDRYCRRLLGRSFVEFLMDARDRRTRARLMQSPSGASYVLLNMSTQEDRRSLLRELELRCIVARSLSNTSSFVVGIGVYDAQQEGFALTVLYYDDPNWTEADAALAREMQEELDFFPTSRLRRLPERE